MDTRSLLDAIKQIAGTVYESRKPARVTYAKLTSISPVAFQKNIKVKLSKELKNLVLPYGVTFLPEDVGSTHVFLQDEGGQVFYYLYMKE
ncbi:hypothetical protein ACKQTC_03090 [Peptococcus simiae]|uniref:Uncharacterized protein n=1 Tax=Peptococcus simiae TaxID=1643805 RepID=A0ABW9GYV3_9FIRM